MIATGFDQSRPLRKLEGPLYRRTVAPVERAAAAPASPAAANVPAKAEAKTYDPEDLEVPSFLRRR